jgi:divalent metal cation (Fe/Co/Zn/Cd) transporter
MSPEVTIHEAHEVAERVEAALRDDSLVHDVQTHLEPLERPIAARPDEKRDEPDEAERSRITHLVRGETAQPPRELRLLPVSGGLVVFVSVVAAAHANLAQAHELASRLEENGCGCQQHRRGSGWWRFRGIARVSMRQRRQRRRSAASCCGSGALRRPAASAR